MDYQDLIIDFMEKAVISKEDVPSDPQGRLSSLIQRVKDEYVFNMPGYIIDESEFEKVENPEKNAKRLHLSLCNARIEDGALKGVNLSLHYRGKLPIELPSVFLRTCYFDLFEIILDSQRLPTDKHWNLILGSPNIGKSLFHVFCLYVLIKANAPVFFHSEHLEDGYPTYPALFYGGEVYYCKSFPKSKLISRSNIWFLHDRKEAPSGIWPANISITVSSPLKRDWYMNHLKESSLPALHMPLWSYEELKHNTVLDPQCKDYRRM